MTKYEILQVYVEIRSTFELGNFWVTRVDHKKLNDSVYWLDYWKAKAAEGYSLAATVTEQNFGGNAGFMAFFQRPVYSNDVVKAS